MRRAITTTLAPNYQLDDVGLSLWLLLKPWRWRLGPAVMRFESAFARWLPVRYAVSFGSGRGALLAILKAMALRPGDEVLLQAFTCVAVPAAVQWAGGTPVYVDIDARTYTADPGDLEQKITARTRAIIVQHTFGYPAEMTRILELARDRKILVIEDCAHALGVRYHGNRLGVLGDAAIFSFGRDKPISSVFGGIAVTNDETLGKKLEAYQRQCPMPPRGWVFQQLLHPVITLVAARTLHVLAFGKILLRLGRISGALSLAVAPAERQGRPTRLARYRMPAALAKLAHHQLGKVSAYSAHRSAIADMYTNALSAVSSVVLPPARDRQRENGYLLYTLQVPDPERLLAAAASGNVHLGEWYRTVIAPHDVNAAAVGYRAGSCPRAEATAARVVNLPTHIGIAPADARRVIQLVRTVCR